MATRAHDRDSKRRGVTINLRAPSETRALIDRAAGLLGKSRSEFMLESARRRAEDVLLDQLLFTMDDRSFAAFVDALEAPPPPNQALKKLLASKAPWET